MHNLFGAMVMTAALATCQTAPAHPPAQHKMPPSEVQACVDDGGVVVLSGFGIETCERATIDAGRSCRQESDCEGFCLAETNAPGGQCAPTTPYFGCNEILVDNGKRVTICVD